MSSNKYHSNGEKEDHHRRLLADKSANDNQEDDNDDCWDDAKEDQVVMSCHEDKQQDAYQSASSSSAYSSMRSAETTNLQQNDNLVLHKAVFEDKLDEVRKFFDTNSKDCVITTINKKDKHGNTALHLACMLGRSKEIIELLLSNGASVDTKNLNRWTPFHEACSYGNRDIISMVTNRLKDDVYDTLNKNKLSENLAKTKNYRLVLRWEFQSWVPFLSRVLPSDVCVINKQDKFIRVDTKMLEFESLPWKRGDSCLIYSTKFEKKWIVVHHPSKSYQHFEPHNLDKDIEDKVDEFMSTDIIDLDLKSADIQLTRSTCGWIWKADKVEKVGRFNAALYNFNNVYLVTRKRREHLTGEDLKRNKIAYKTAVHVLKFGQKPTPLQASKDLDGSRTNIGNDTEEDDEAAAIATTEGYDDESNSGDANASAASDAASDSSSNHRESLPPPPARRVTWNEYCRAEPGDHPTLGREQICKVVKRAFRASVAMSEEFPITKNEFLDLLSIIPLKHFKKMKEFIEGRLPDGFPVRVDVPIFPFLTARITFEDFRFVEGPVDESLFIIPSDYKEDTNLLRRLTGTMKNRSTN